MTENIEFYDYGEGVYEFVFVLNWFILTVSVFRYFEGEDVKNEIKGGEVESCLSIKEDKGNKIISTIIKKYEGWEFNSEGRIKKYIDDFLSTNAL